MNNKPVAWIDAKTGKPRMEGFIQTDHDIPLYTHPVNPYQSITNTKIEPTVVSYTHPVKEMSETSYETVFDGEKYTTKLVEPAKELTDEVKDALMDALSGWRYIRECHGDLYGVGWDRVQDKLEAILRKASEK